MNILTDLWTLLVICVITVAILCSCNEPSTKTKSHLPLINKFIEERLPKEDSGIEYNYIISDSMVVKSLQTSLYRVQPDGIADATEYILLIDQQTQRIYPLVFEHWGRYNKLFSKELALNMLEKDDDRFDFEAVDYQFLHLGIFLNQCKALENDTLNYSSVDSIFRFYMDDYFYRIQTAEKLDSLVLISVRSTDGLKIDSSYAREIALLKKKIKEPGVFLYQGHPDYDFEYFEINAAKDIPRLSGHHIYKNMYNLKVLSIF